MRSAALLMLTLTIGLAQRASVNQSDFALARDLADEFSRHRAVAGIEASGGRDLPTLLSWTTEPPPGVDNYELNVGLADAFGAMKTAQAVPFLIKHISIDRTHAVNTWLKAPEVIEERLAAVAALIHIGPGACQAVIEATWKPMSPQDKIAAVFLVSRMHDQPTARAFLTSTLGEANLQRYWAEDGLRRINENRSSDRKP